MVLGEEESCGKTYQSDNATGSMVLNHINHIQGKTYGVRVSKPPPKKRVLSYSVCEMGSFSFLYKRSMQTTHSTIRRLQTNMGDKGSVSCRTSTHTIVKRSHTKTPPVRFSFGFSSPQIDPLLHCSLDIVLD